MNAKVNISNRAGASFPVRRMNFDFDQVPEYWMNGSAGLTHFMTALSALFPDGEKLFIDSVRAVRYHPAIKDNEALQKEISAFIGQEAMHTQEHVGFNASAQKYGHDVSSLERITGRYIQFARKNFAKAVKPFGMTQEMVDLTATTALEHFTATIASELLRNLHIQELMTDDTMSYPPAQALVATRDSRAGSLTRFVRSASRLGCLWSMPPYFAVRARSRTMT